MKIFLRYALELAIVIPDAVFVFLPVLEDLRGQNRITYGISGLLLSVFVIAAAWLSAANMLQVLPVLAVGVLFLFLIFFFSVNISLGRKLFCFFNAVMLEAFSRLCSVAVMASTEGNNELWKTTRLLSLESGLVSLGFSILLGLIFLKVLTKELPLLLKEEHVNEIWDFLFLLPFGVTILIWWMTPIHPDLLLIARARIILLALLPLIPMVVLLIYYLLWWMATKFSESARLQQTNMLLAVESKRYEELRNYMDETRTLRHNFRQHIISITSLANSEKISELKNYLLQFNEATEKSYSGYCDSIIVDAVASYYTSLAEKQGTRIEWKLNLPRELPLNEAEYCVILGNLLENALRAVKNLAEERRYVKVISSLYSETIVAISIDNPFSGKIKFGRNGLPKSERGGHGIGLTSVLDTVKRYDGSMNITTENKIFTVDIVLHCN